MSSLRHKMEKTGLTNEVPTEEFSVQKSINAIPQQSFQDSKPIPKSSSKRTCVALGPDLRPVSETNNSLNNFRLHIYHICALFQFPHLTFSEIQNMEVNIK